MKELDVVRLTKEFEGLAIGTKGTMGLYYPLRNVKKPEKST